MVTSHKAQGRTHDQVVIAAEQLDSKAAYVACSRGRREARVFTPEKAHLMKRLERSGDRLAATDVIGSSRSAFWKHSEQMAWQRAAKDATLFHASLQQSQSFEIQIGR